jgi:hypothetical protein
MGFEDTGTQENEFPSKKLVVPKEPEFKFGGVAKTPEIKFGQ